MNALAKKHSFVLVCSAFILNLIFLACTYKNNYYLGLLTPHGEIAYNIYRYNSVKCNPERLRYIDQRQQELGTMVDYAEIDAHSYGAPTHYRGIQDTVGYGVLLGILWKLTGSLRYLDIQLLQIIIFSLLMIVVYSLAFLIFNDHHTALWCGVAHLCYLPLIYLNVQACRDIWAYYGVLILIWGLAAYLFSFVQYRWFFFVAVAFSCIQHLRPTILLHAVVAGIVMAIAIFFKKVSVSRSLKALLTVALLNIIIFWLPFCAHNKAAYNSWFVFPSGQGLLEGLGEYPNAWGFRLHDGWVGSYLYDKYKVRYGTPEFDRAATQEFLKAYRENPWFFYRNIARRLPLVILPGLPWNNISNVSDENTYDSLWHKITAKIRSCFSSPSGIADFFTRHIYLRIYLLWGYCGMALMLLKRKYLWCALLVGAAILPSWGCIQSHVEYRYLIPFYSFFAFFVGYAGVFFRRVFSDNVPS